MTAGVYCITNTMTGKVYVGFGLDVVARMTAHIRSLGLGRHFCRALQADWDTYGADAFTVELAEEIDGDLDIQIAAEERWIEQAMDSPSGAYNRHRSCQARASYVRRYQRWRALRDLEREMIEERRPTKRRRPSSTAAGGEGES